MLPAHHRLRSRQAFEHVYKKGQRQSGSLFTVSWLLIPQAEPDPVVTYPSQIGLVVSKKVSKLAVERNLVKRRLRSAFTPLLPKLKPGYWIIVSTRGSALAASYLELEAEVHRLLRKTHLWPVEDSLLSAQKAEKDIKIG